MPEKAKKKTSDTLRLIGFKFDDDGRFKVAITRALWLALRSAEQRGDVTSVRGGKVLNFDLTGPGSVAEVAASVSDYALPDDPCVIPQPGH